MTADNKYRQVLTDNFPAELKIVLGDQELIYHKQIYRLPDETGKKVEGGLRYGENPGQEAALYRLVNGNLYLSGVAYVGPDKALVSSLADGDPLNNMMYGCRKHPSKTNLTDVDAALSILRYLTKKPTAVIVKHNNPSGVAQDESLARAFYKAYRADSVAAFGGAAVFNRSLDLETTKLLIGKYLEVLAAPDFEEGVLSLLTNPDLRIFKIKNIEKLSDFKALRFLDIKSLIDGGLVLQQSAVNQILEPNDFQKAKSFHKGKEYASLREPDKKELDDLVFGWAVEQGVISNSVLFVKDEATVAIGGGQQDRVGVVEIAVHKAYRNFCENLSLDKFGQSFKKLVQKSKIEGIESEQIKDIETKAIENKGGLKGSRLISDAFFPFRDAVDVALAEGITAVAHPGGSLRDWESIEAVNENKPPVAMVFSGQRAFKH